MAWYRPDLYHRVLTLFGHVREPAVAATTPRRRAARGSFTSSLIPNSPAKPIRIWMDVGDRDLLNPNIMRDDMHDWVSRTRTWPRCWPPRATTTSSCSPATPATAIAP